MHEAASSLLVCATSGQEARAVLVSMIFVVALRIVVGRILSTERADRTRLRVRSLCLLLH